MLSRTVTIYKHIEEVIGKLFHKSISFLKSCNNLQQEKILITNIFEKY